MSNCRYYNIILKKFRGVCAKLPGIDYFLDFMNYFSKEKSRGIGPRSVDRVHGDQSTDHRIGNDSRPSILRWASRI
jgi:hypothetical protein